MVTQKLLPISWVSIFCFLLNNFSFLVFFVVAFFSGFVELEDESDPLVDDPLSEVSDFVLDDRDDDGKDDGRGADRKAEKTPRKPPPKKRPTRKGH